MEMEIVVGIGEEARPKACSSEIGSAKQQDEDLGEKTLEENGVRVSENGEQNDVDDNKSKENVVSETENLNDSGVIEDCVMNGVSSLLKLKQDVSDKEKEIEDGAKVEAGEEEDEEEEEHGYQVGDFVWGKIKNHPWWPGQIYDPSEASDLALKIKQKGKLLVAYFGDGTFAWCGPLQLKPFAESFKECSNVSNSRGFLTAVEEAVEEMGRHMEFLLVHDCAEEKKHDLDNPKVKNAGIKEGVVVRDVKREMISSLLVGKPEGILQDVKAFAETVSFSGLLELEVLKRKVSAFYRSKRGYGLTEYHEPESVPGLEDKNNDDDSEDDENVDDGIKWMRSGAKRSIKEKEEVVDPEESLPRSLEKYSAFPDHRLQHRRKQKSIAEILDNEAVAKVRFEIEPEDRSGKPSRKRVKRCGEVKGGLAAVTTTTPRGRRMKEAATIEEDGGHELVEVNNKGKKNSRKRKKKDVDDGDNDGSGDREETEKKEVPVDETYNDSTPLASLRKRVKVDASSAANGEASTQTTKRERKKSKYFSPEYLSDFSSKGRKKNKIESESSKVRSQSQVEEQMTNATDSLVPMEEDKSIASDSLVAVEEDKVDKPCESLLENGVGHQEEVSEEVSNAVEFLRLGATAEEIRDLIHVSALGTQYPKDSSSRDMVREFMSIYRSFTYRDGANSKFLGCYNSGDADKEEVNGITGKPETKGKARKDKRKAKQQTEEIEQVGKEENETDKHETAKKERKPKMPKSKKQADEEEESRKESSEAPKKERKRKKQADEEEETRKELTETTNKERKRNKPESKKQADEKEETLKEANESIKKERKRKSESKKEVEEEEETLKEAKESTKREREAKKPKYEEEETRNETEKKNKREGESKELKVDKKKIETEKESSGAELLVTFGPGSSLPKKEELIEIYEKFGALDEEKTEMFYTNFCACVAFLNIADGEKAFESSEEKCPFTATSSVKFRLKYPNERAEEKKAEAEVAETTTMEMEHLKKKLEEMISLVDGSAGEMTEEMKVKLEEEMVNLLEKVRKMPSF